MRKFAVMGSLLMLLTGNVQAQEDCDAAARLIQQADQITPLAARLNDYLQARSLCPGDAKVHYRSGLALMASERYTEAHTAFLDAMERATQQHLPPTMRMEIMGRLAENDYRSNDRPKALLGFKVASDFARKHQMVLPDWVLALQKDMDQQLDARPLTATELRASLRSMRDLGVEASVDYRVLFEFDSDQPTAEGRQQLQQIAEALQQSDSTRIEVVGHTDVRGKPAYNLALSERRAQRIVALLVQTAPALKGMLHPSGKGMTQPKYPGNTAEDHQFNRRVEFLFGR